MPDNEGNKVNTTFGGNDEQQIFREILKQQKYLNKRVNGLVQVFLVLTTLMMLMTILEQARFLKNIRVINNKMDIERHRIKSEFYKLPI